MDWTGETIQWNDMKDVFSKDLMDALLHNKPPREETLRTIAAIRRNPETLVTASIERLQCIDREINRLKKEQEKLSNTARVRATICSACDTVSAPIRRLSFDIIREIALFALDEHPSASINSSLMILTRVCSAWRSVVLSAPLLWSTPYLKIDAVDQDSIVKHVGTVQNWFQRASSAPKRFFLYVACPIATGTPSYLFHLFLKAIGPSLSGLSSLGIGSRNWASLMAHFVDITWDVSDLKSVELLGQLAHRDNDHLEQEMVQLASVADRIILFRKASLLTKMVAVQELRPFPLSSAFLPWHQIVDISLQESQCSQICVIDTLRNAPQLQTVRLSCGSLQQREGTATLIHRNLERLTLRISKSNAHDLLAFLNKCAFPNLKEMSLTVVLNVKGNQPNDRIPTINTFPSLETLILGEDMRMPTNHLLGLFRGTPNLQTLLMVVVDSDGRSTDLNNVFTSLTIKGHCKILPRLERCNFYGISDTPGTKFFLDTSLVSRFIHSRFQDLPEGCSRLKEIQLMGCFKFLTNLQAEVDYLSQGKNSIFLLVGGGAEEDIFAYIHDPVEALKFHIPFTPSYAKVVGHKIRLTETS